MTAWRRKPGGSDTSRQPYPPQWRITMSRSATARKLENNNIADRVGALDWSSIGTQLDQFGCATTGRLLSADECAAISSRYGDDPLYRSRVLMARHGFG